MKPLRAPRAAPARRFQSCLLIGLLLGFGLSACVQSPTATPPANQDAAAPPPPEPEPEVAALPPAEETPQPNQDPQELMGLAPEGVARLLGEPALLRRESPAQIWQYRGDDCVFDIVLYEEAGGQRVSYIEARDKTGKRVATKPCYNALLSRRAATS